MGERTFKLANKLNAKMVSSSGIEWCIHGSNHLNIWHFESFSFSFWLDSVFLFKCLASVHLRTAVFISCSTEVSNKSRQLGRDHVTWWKWLTRTCCAPARQTDSVGLAKKNKKILQHWKICTVVLQQNLCVHTVVIPGSRRFTAEEERREKSVCVWCVSLMLVTFILLLWNSMCVSKFDYNTTACVSEQRCSDALSDDAPAKAGWLILNQTSLSHPRDSRGWRSLCELALTCSHTPGRSHSSGPAALESCSAAIPAEELRCRGPVTAGRGPGRTRGPELRDKRLWKIRERKITKNAEKRCSRSFTVFSSLFFVFARLLLPLLALHWTAAQQQAAHQAV